MWVSSASLAVDNWWTEGIVRHHDESELEERTSVFVFKLLNFSASLGNGLVNLSGLNLPFNSLKKGGEMRVHREDKMQQ